MGLFGGDNDNEPSRAEQLMEQQYQEGQAELELKKQNLYKTRLGIIKSQGGESWTPDMSGTPTRSGRSRGVYDAMGRVPFFGGLGKD